jgi:hypothetical protein
MRFIIQSVNQIQSMVIVLVVKITIKSDFADINTKDAKESTIRRKKI